MELHEVAADRRRLLRLDEGLVEAAGRRVGQDRLEQVDRAGGRVGARRHVIRGGDRLNVADALEPDAALAILRWVERVEVRQLAGGLGDPSERGVDPAERLGLVESAGHQQDRVVGLVVHAVEGLQPLDRYVLEIGLRADRGLAVVVPEERGREDALLEDRARVVLAHLELVADDGHLAVEVLLGHEGMDHAVRFHLERPLQVHVARLQRFEIVRAVEPRRSIGSRAVRGQLLVDLGVVRRALEEHVLEQVRHARLAVVLVARADLVGEVDRDRGLRRVGKEQHAQTVSEPVLGDAFDRCDLDGSRVVRADGRGGALGLAGCRVGVGIGAQRTGKSAGERPGEGRLGKNPHRRNLRERRQETSRHRRNAYYRRRIPDRSERRPGAY